MTQRVIILSCMVLLVAIVTEWLIDGTRDAPIESDLTRNDPDTYMVDATIREFDEQGELQHTLQAARYTHFPLTDVTQLEAPRIELKSQTRQPWKIKSNHGRLLSQSDFREQVVELWDDVVAVGERGDGRTVKIQTQSLTVYPEREYAETNEKVFIDDSMGRTTASGLKAFFKTGEFTFIGTEADRINTIYQPAPR